MLNPQNSRTNQRLFQFSLPGKSRPASGPLHAALRIAEQMTGIEEINSIYARASESPESGSFHDRLLRVLNISLQIADSQLERIPRTGPLVVTANHPFGGVEGIALAALLARIRPDCKLMANYLLSKVPEFRENMLYVDPFGGTEATAGNLASMRKAVRWLKEGGALAVFPAGEVAHLRWGQHDVVEGPWSANVARLIEMSQAPVVPIFFDGQNSPFFQAMGLIHPKLRTALLARELLNKQASTLKVHIGSPIPWRRLSSLGGPDRIAAYVRQRTLILRYRGRKVAASKPAGTGVVRPIAPQTSVAGFAVEVEGLPADALLVEHDGLRVYVRRGDQVPQTLREIARLRENTYREVGEGTGQELDTDRFDQWYEHLFVWNVAKAEVVGAYRLGRCDQILATHGLEGLYTSTLFDFRDDLLTRLGPALELGRSFVRREYQRSYAPLMLLWRGIGRFVVRHPQYKMLFGPVSISSEYQSISRQLMVEFLARRHSADALSSLAAPRRPFESTGLRDDDLKALDELLRESDDLGDLVSEFEPDHKGIPVLLRQYLKLGAKFFAFNVDTHFNDAIDALMCVDLTQTERRTLDRYLTKEGAEAFLAHHAVPLPLPIMN